MNDIECTLLVLGGGPGGYVTAIRAAQAGIDTVLVEQAALGGTCLNVGCIPSKALIHAADEFHRVSAFAQESQMGINVSQPTLNLSQTMHWKGDIVRALNTGVASLLERAGVHVIHGKGVLLDAKTCRVHPSEDNHKAPGRIRCEQLVLATGSVSTSLAKLPFGGKILSSTELLQLEQLPGRLAVVGGGYIGLELACAFAKLGCEVTVIEAAERVLNHYDSAHARVVTKGLERLGITLLCRARARLAKGGETLQVQLQDDTQQTVAFDRVLVATGRRPATEGFGLERLALEYDGPFVRIDAACRTAMHNVYAIGDLTGEPMLAHRAMAQGELVASRLLGGRQLFDKVCIPSVCYTDPEVVVAGITAEQLSIRSASTATAQRLAPHGVKTGRFAFSASGRAMTMGRTDGFVEVLARADNHLLLGLSAVGTGVSELAGGFSLALEMGACLEDLALTVHAHPTLGEAVQEAALKALGSALHG